MAVEPPRGWNGVHINHSRVTLEWLLWNEHQLPSSSSTPRIQHLRNGGEQTIPAPPSAYHVDGLDRTTHTVYEFHDPSQTSFSSSGRTMEALYQATIQKTQTLRDIRYTVYEMWECEWHAKVKAPPEIQGFSGVSRHSATSESLGRVFRGTYRCCFALLQSGRDPRGRNTLRRRDV